MVGPVVSIPLWLLLALAAFCVGVLCWVIINARKRQPRDHPPPELFTSAQIFGITWRWGFREGDISDVGPFCPRCDRPVLPTEEVRHGFLRLVAYRCDCSQWRSRSFQCSHDALIDRVSAAIRQELQNRQAA